MIYKVVDDKDRYCLEEDSGVHKRGQIFLQYGCSDFHFLPLASPHFSFGLFCIVGYSQQIHFCRVARVSFWGCTSFWRIEDEV